MKEVSVLLFSCVAPPTSALKIGTTSTCAKHDESKLMRLASWTQKTPFVSERRKQTQKEKKLDKYGLHEFDMASL